MSRKIVLLTGGYLATPSAKTALSMLRYRAEEVVAVLDPPLAGRTCQEAVGLGGSIPVVAYLGEVALADTLVVGIAPPGGKLPPAMKAVVLQAIARRMNIISGLHDFVSEDPEIRQAAGEAGVKLVDLRQNQERDVARRQGVNDGCLRILTVGQDCSVGKMTACLEMERVLRARGVDAKFVATGQTGILIDGEGCPIDAVVVDFVNGAAEKLVLANQHHEILLIEGQGSIAHPRYSAVTCGLLHGTMPHGMILCYEMGRPAVYGMDHVPLTPLGRLVEVYEMMATLMHPSKVIGVAVNSRRFEEKQAAMECERIHAELGLPVCDVIRHGPDVLVQAVLSLQSSLGK